MGGGKGNVWRCLLGVVAGRGLLPQVLQLSATDVWLTGLFIGNQSEMPQNKPVDIEDDGMVGRSG